MVVILGKKLKFQSSKKNKKLLLQNNLDVVRGTTRTHIRRCTHLVY